MTSIKKILIFALQEKHTIYNKHNINKKLYLLMLIYKIEDIIKNMKCDNFIPGMAL
jgi:hypothetical protein